MYYQHQNSIVNDWKIMVINLVRYFLEKYVPQVSMNFSQINSLYLFYDKIIRAFTTCKLSVSYAFFSIHCTRLFHILFYFISLSLLLYLFPVGFQLSVTFIHSIFQKILKTVVQKIQCRPVFIMQY